jgi:predicted MFS family arabinose efflux permease
MNKNTPPQDTGFASPRTASAILAILFVVYASNYADRYVVASLLGFIKDDWGISDSQAGWLMGAVIGSPWRCSPPSTLTA